MTADCHSSNCLVSKVPSRLRYSASKVLRGSEFSTPYGASAPSSQSPANAGTPASVANRSASVDLPVPGNPVNTATYRSPIGRA